MSKAETTRLNILQKASELVYQYSYQATSIDDIIAETQVTKGAFYYHFKSKEAMGLAMIKEVIYPGMYSVLVKPLLDATDPIDEIYRMMKNVLIEESFFQVKYGCPAINLIEEMAPLHASFKGALTKLSSEWQGAIASAIDKGKTSGHIRKEIDPEQVACFIVVGYGGIRNLGKLFGNSSYESYLKELKNYLNTLK